MSKSYRYLLDTNAISDLMKNPQGRTAKHIAQVGEEAVCTSIIVAAELEFGVQKKGSAKLQERLSVILSAIDVLPLEKPAEAKYGDLRYHLEKQGTPIGGNDLLIAAHALSLGLCVVTQNVREFERVPELSVENWLNMS
uniref:Ribonuclease VapC n=1 Tax=uncultured Thiotrichaceae bacterium TaxID=298394 RepID=A0A6S6UHS1_9GAMM|nr:MAG: VapC toxin protein [uncultured Thiotrichaceae bacterium]